MPKKTPAADQFAALGIPRDDWTDAMKLAVTQKWGDLPVTEKVADLRTSLAAVTTADVGTVADVKAQLLLSGATIVTEADAVAEHKRLKRNAAVQAWRKRNQIQAALDARELKFAQLRAKRGKTAAPRGGTATGDATPLAAAV